jgi:hypothetical protein
LNQLVPPRSSQPPALIAAAGDRARVRFLEFFAANIRNPHTRRASALDYIHDDGLPLKLGHSTASARSLNWGCGTGGISFHSPL